MLYSIRMRAIGPKGVHISGAEGIYDAAAVQSAASSYTKRALEHPRGEPHDISVTVERLKIRPQKIESLPVSTLRCGSPGRAEKIIRELLRSSGIGARAINTALKVVYSQRAMRGAALIDTQTGKRLEPDRTRGIRATRMGISKAANTSLSRKLARHGINNDTVKEALVLASKVAGAPGVVAELCVSDDPHYTTGYVASPVFGYVRIPHIKKKGSRAGGRAVFTSNAKSTGKLITYLEDTAVLVTAVSAVEGMVTLGSLLPGD